MSLHIISLSSGSHQVNTPLARRPAKQQLSVQTGLLCCQLLALCLLLPLLASKARLRQSGALLLSTAGRRSAAQAACPAPAAHSQARALLLL